MRTLMCFLSIKAPVVTENTIMSLFSSALCNVIHEADLQALFRDVTGFPFIFTIEEWVFTSSFGFVSFLSSVLSVF